MNFQIKILDPRIEKLPTYATPGSAGLDLVAAINGPYAIDPGGALLIPSGISIYIGDPRYAAMILPRSGLGHKLGLVLGNGTGLIDSDYQGPIMMSLFNRSREVIRIEPMMRVAQLIFTPILRPSLRLVEQFDESTQRDQGGFGSTG